MHGLTASLPALLVSPVVAATFTYGSRSDFAAGLSTHGYTAIVENYDAAAPGTQIPSGSTFNGLQYEFSSSIQSYGAVLAISNGPVATSPPNTLGVFLSNPGLQYHSGIVAGQQVTITFGGLVDAVGIWFNTVDPTAGGIRITTDTGVSVLSGLDPHPVGGFYGQFAGLVETGGFTSITIEAARSGYTFVLDDLTYAMAAVPTPAAVWAAAPVLAGA